MRPQHGFTLIEVMIAVALLSVLVAGIATVAVGQWQQGRLAQTLKEMQSIAAIANDYRRLRDNSGHYTSSGPVQIKQINQRFNVGLPAVNPWGKAYEVRNGPMAAVVSTTVPVDVAPDGFRSTDIGSGLTKLERQDVGNPGPISNHRLRAMKKQVYLETSR